MGIIEKPFLLSDAWVEILRSCCDADGCLNYEDFTRLALYHDVFGYYRKPDRKRVAKAADADFYTASNHTLVFPDLVLDAAQQILSAAGMEPSLFEFCELGAEPETDAWSGKQHPFAETSVQRLGAALDIPTHAVVFSNELFDAQPFHRWIAQDGQWHPVHLRLQGNHLSEVRGDGPLSSSEAAACARLPEAPEFEYQLDLSTSAVELMQHLCDQHWQGLMLAFDYGTQWKQRVSETPQGTARAYRHHQQTGPLFHHPGEQDLTTHVCWDSLSEVLKGSGFTSIQLRSQARFFMETATDRIQQIVTASTTLTDARKSQLLELISPGFFGHKFQVLSALRSASAP